MTARVSPLRADELDTATKVLNAGLGDGFVSAADLASYISPDRLALAYRTEHLLGVLTGQFFTDSGALVDTVPKDMAKRFEALLPTGPAGLIKSVAVNPAAQGQGAASTLIAKACAALMDMGSRTLVSIGWTDEDECHIEGALRRSGFTARGDINDFWYRDSVIHGYACPTCGFGCRCTARIFAR